MTENIKKLANDALGGINKFEKGGSCPENESELKSAIAVARGLERFFKSVPVRQYPGEKLFGRLRFDGCEYPSDFYRRAGHRNLNRYWQGLCSGKPSKVFY